MILNERSAVMNGEYLSTPSSHPVSAMMFAQDLDCKSREPCYEKLAEIHHGISQHHAHALLKLVFVMLL